MCLGELLLSLKGHPKEGNAVNGLTNLKLYYQFALRGKADGDVPKFYFRFCS